MPYDLCEDEPTLDVIETCMAYQGKGGVPGMGTGERVSWLQARLMLPAQEVGRVLVVVVIQVTNRTRPQKAPGKRAVQEGGTVLITSPTRAGGLSWPRLLFVSCDNSIQ